MAAQGCCIRAEKTCLPGRLGGQFPSEIAADSHSRCLPACTPESWSEVGLGMKADLSVERAESMLQDYVNSCSRKMPARWQPHR
jgi:hypothetical protein